MNERDAFMLMLNNVEEKLSEKVTEEQYEQQQRENELDKLREEKICIFF